MLKTNDNLSALEKVRTRRLLNDLNNKLLNDNLSALEKIRTKRLINDLNYKLFFEKKQK